MGDQFVKELGADQSPRTGHGFSEQVIFNAAQHGTHLALHIGTGRAKDKVDRDLLQTKLGEVIVKRGARAILHNAAQGVHLHIFPGLGMLAPHQGQLAVHHRHQRIGGV